MSTNVRLKLQQLSKGGISHKEVQQLERAIGVVDRRELSQLRQGAIVHKDQFTTKSRDAYEKLLGKYDDTKGRVERRFDGFQQAWKLESDPEYRKRWGWPEKFDPKLPAFERDAEFSAVPRSLAGVFRGFASWMARNLRDEAPHLGGRSLHIESLFAKQLFDRNKSPVGWTLRAEFTGSRWVEAFYRNDGVRVNCHVGPNRES